MIMNQYEIRICSCGTIHFIPNEKVEKALQEEKNLLWICGTCGQGTYIGGDKEPNIWDDSPDAPEFCYNMYSTSLNPNSIHDSISITKETFDGTDKEKGISEIFYSPGIKVPMKSGSNARMYNSANQYFLDIWWPDWYKVERNDFTREDILNFIKEYKKDCQTINMSLFIHQTPEHLLKILAQCYMPEFDWTGTPYEKIHQEMLNKLHGKE